MAREVAPLIVVGVLTTVVAWALIASGRARGAARPELLGHSGRAPADRATTYLITCAHEPTRQPVSLDLLCGNGTYALNHMTWTSWGGPTASGEGRYVEQTCDPDCARSADVSYPVAVTATDPVRINGVSAYRKIVLRWTGARPSGASLPVETFDFVDNGAIRGPGAP